jgi:hypothetical protein
MVVGAFVAIAIVAPVTPFEPIGGDEDERAFGAYFHLGRVTLTLVPRIPWEATLATTVQGVCVRRLGLQNAAADGIGVEAGGLGAYDPGVFDE